jgi:CRP/FNR family transcriptional regulator
VKPLLQTVSKEFSEKLHKLGRSKIFLSDREIFAEGEKAEFLPIVIRGKIKMVRYPEAGKEVIIGFFQDGEMFAVPPAFDGGNYPATAIAMEKTKLLILFRQDFLKLLRESSEFSFAVIEWMCGMLREKTATINNLVTSSPEQRVANVLLRLMEKENTSFPVKISLRRQDIAEMAGLTTETTIRAVKRLSERNLLTIIHGKIILENPQVLREFLQ